VYSKNPHCEKNLNARIQNTVLSVLPENCSFIEHTIKQQNHQ